MPQQATQKSSKSAMPFWLDATPEGAFGGLMKNAQAAFESSFKEYCEETLSFLNKRLEHNRTAIEQYRACKDGGDLVSAQQKWLMELVHDYFDEATRLSEVNRKILADGLGASGNGSKQPAA